METSVPTNSSWRSKFKKWSWLSVKGFWHLLITLTFLTTILNGTAIRDLQLLMQISPMVLVLSFLHLVVVFRIMMWLHKKNPKVFGPSIYSHIRALISKNYSKELTGTDENFGQNIQFTAVKVPYFGLLFCVLLFLNVPMLVTLEEMIFRNGTVDWLDAIVRSLLFAGVHLLIGIPLCGVIAFVFSGLWLSLIYFIGGTELSILHHATFNYMLVGIIFFGLLFRHYARLKVMKQNKSTPSEMTAV